MLARGRRAFQFRQPAFEETPLGAVVRELSGTSVGVARFVGAPEAPQEFGPAKSSLVPGPHSCQPETRVPVSAIS